MSRGIIKLEHHGEERYLEWSTVVDAPVTYGMTVDELRERVRRAHGELGLSELPSRLARIEATGTSYYDTTLEEILGGNRAGPDESSLTIEQIWQAYVVERPGNEA